MNLPWYESLEPDGVKHQKHGDGEKAALRRRGAGGFPTFSASDRPKEAAVRKPVEDK